jgi:integrase
MKGPRKQEDGRWKVDERPLGRNGPRFRKIFDSKAEANQYFKWLQAESTASKDWSPAAKETRHLSDLVEDWYSLHGYTLKGGKERKSYLLSLCQLMGNPLATQFSGEDFARFRQLRMDGGLTTSQWHRGGISPNTCNHDLAYLKAVFNELIRLKNWKKENPLTGVRPLKIDEEELSYLELNQIDTLLGFLSRSKSTDVYMVAKICLATGARWSEAQNLRGEQVRHGKITFAKTKSSKARTVPISKKLEEEIFTNRTRTGSLFSYCYKAFIRALEATYIELPARQKTHVLRHSFASHFMMAGGNLLTLSKILGHSDVKITMRYAHLSPAHFEEAIHLNPLVLSETAEHA